jgi:hypothetical protein
VSGSLNGIKELKLKSGFKKGLSLNGNKPARLSVITITKNTDIRVAMSCIRFAGLSRPGLNHKYQNMTAITPPLSRLSAAINSTV